MREQVDPPAPEGPGQETKSPPARQPESAGEEPCGQEVRALGAGDNDGGVRADGTTPRRTMRWGFILLTPIRMTFRAYHWLDTGPGRSLAGVVQIVGVLLASVALGIASVQLRSASVDQAKARRYQAWQAINQSQGKPGNGGRVEALEDLNADSISLAGIDLGGGAALEQIRLPGANLRGAKFPRAILKDAVFHSAHLEDVDLSDADLTRVDLRKAILKRSNLQHALLLEADLRGAVLYRTDFRYANLKRADFSGATIQKEAILFGEADLAGANLSAAKGLIREHILAARDWRGARLPGDLKDLELPDDAKDQDLQRLKSAR